MNLEQVSFIKTSRDWFLASCLYDSIMDMDISQTIMLLETKKANPNILLPEYGVSPFHLIIGSENRKFACRATKVFLLNGADPNIRSDEGVTPVHIAAMWGYTDVLDLLLSAGGNPWLVDYDGKNAFQYAEEEKNWEAYNLLYNNCDMENFISTLCNIPVCSLELNKDSKKCSRCDVRIQHDGKKHLTGVFDKDNLKVQFDQCSIKDKNLSLHNESLKIILNHRKKTTIYEYNPKQGNQDCTLEKPGTTDTESYFSQTIKESGQNVNFLSELKIKQNKKFVCGNDENWENNINKAISLFEKEENNGSPLSDENEIHDRINQSKYKIGLVTDYTENSPVCGQTINKEASCTKLDCKLAIQHKQFQSSMHGNNMFSTRSIKNFTKDSHEVSNLSSHETYKQTDIFSDIDSDISVCVMSGILQSSKNIDELLTDDEVFVSEELTSSKLLVNNENVSSSNTCMSTASCTSDSEISDKNLCSAESEILQSDSIQNSRICDLAVDINETTAAIDSEVHNERPTSYSHKWVEADVFSSDDDRELSISEEYLYTDDEEGIVLTEKRYLSNSVRIPALLSHRNDEDYCSVTDTDTSSTSAYNTDTLKKELNTYGFCPGPITGQTKRVYLRKLKHFRCHPCLQLEQSKPEYSPELQRVLALPNMYLLKEWSQLEQKMCYEFSLTSCTMSWRGGVAKTSFTYLLLDPRITCNLPAATSNLQLNQIWETFLQAIFYVGKGKRSRPYSHLYQSVAVWEKRHSEKHFSKKVERILEIWHSGHGVVCLHVFQNIIPVEAYTREAAMISALTVGRLANEKSGEFYGPCANWPLRQKRQLGAVLLYRACQVFMGEGERQIRPADVD